MAIARGGFGDLWAASTARQVRRPSGPCHRATGALRADASSVAVFAVLGARCSGVIHSHLDEASRQRLLPVVCDGLRPREAVSKEAAGRLSGMSRASVQGLRLP